MNKIAMKTRFYVRVNKARCDLKVLSNQHGDKPEQFNYLGEWHSHPNAPVTPSVIDEITMRELLDDPETTVNFLVLLINRLNESGMLEIFASAYLASGHKIPCEIILEPNKLTSWTSNVKCLKEDVVPKLAGIYMVTLDASVPCSKFLVEKYRWAY